MTRRAWRVLVALVVVAGVVTSPSPVGAVPVIAPGDAVELANKLTEATEEQRICYGWSVRVFDESGPLSGIDQGSSLGPGADPFDPVCTPHVVFTAELYYTASTSEMADSADFAVRSNLLGFDPGSLQGLGVTEEGLLGGNDDLVVANATALLPALVAEQGLAPPIPIEETTGTIPASDRPTNTPGSDRWRTHWPLYVLPGLVVVGGLGWLVLAFVVRRVQSTQPDFTLSSLFETD